MRRRIIGRLQAEDGAAMAVAIAVLAIMIMLASVAVWQSVAALKHSDREVRVKTAGQAADGAINAAIYHHDRIDLENAINLPRDPTAVPSQACVAILDDDLQVVNMAADVVPDFEGRRWCPPVTEDQGDAVSWSYRVSELARVGIGPCGEERVVALDRTVVAVGVSRTAVRRVKVTLRAPITLLSGAAVQSASSTSPLVMGDTASVVGDVRSNGDITSSGSSTTTTATAGGVTVTSTTTSTSGGTVTGNAIPGPPAHTVAGGVTVTGTRTPACEQFDLPPVNAGTSDDDNDNGTIAHDGMCLDQALELIVRTCQPTALSAPTGTVTYDPGKRTLALTGDARLVLGGDTYSFCKLTLSGQSSIVVPSNSVVTRIFIEDPTSERCKDVDGAGQVAIDGSSRMINCHAATNPETLQLYALGSPTASTVQSLAGGGALSAAALLNVCGVLEAAGTPMFVYAPRSTVQVRGSTQIVGQVAGGVVQLGGAARVTAITGPINLGSLGAGAILPVYTPVDYVECSARSFSDPEILANPSKEC